MLIAGASASVCVDCGHGQLHKKLCDDDRVVSLEGINARTLVATQLPHASFDFITVDVSFISLELVLPALWPLLDTKLPHARLVALVKPQFEAGHQLGESGLKALRKGKGVLTDRGMQMDILCSLVKFANELEGCAVVGSIESPIRGGDGNREFLISLARSEHDPTPGPFVDEVRVPAECDDTGCNSGLRSR